MTAGRRRAVRQWSGWTEEVVYLGRDRVLTRPTSGTQPLTSTTQTPPTPHPRPAGQTGSRWKPDHFLFSCETVTTSSAGEPELLRLFPPLHYNRHISWINTPHNTAILLLIDLFIDLFVCLFVILIFRCGVIYNRERANQGESVNITLYKLNINDKEII